MNPSSSATLLAMLAAAVSTASAIPLYTPQANCVHLHNLTGPVTVILNGPAGAGVGYGTLAIVLVCILIIPYLLYTIPPWLRHHLSRTEPEHVHRVVPSGRSSAVSLGVEARTVSPAEQLAVSFDEAIASGNVPPPDKPPPPTESTALVYQALPRVYTKSNPSSSVDHPGGTSGSSFINCYNRCASHRRGYRVAQNDESAVQPELHYCPPCSSAHHATIGISSPSERVKSASQSGNKIPSTSESSSHPTSDVRSPLMGALGGLGIAYTVVAFSFLAVELDWSDDETAPLPGVKDDLEWLTWMSSGPDSNVTLRTITNATDATKDNIRSKILEMFVEACLGTVIVLHLNGHGAKNSFLLYNFEQIDAALLIEWIKEIRVKTDRHLTVCILFDHCQFDASIPLPDIQPGEDIHILWGCLPRQRSADFKMAGDDEAKIPRSNLLKAICLLVDDIRTHPAGPVDCFMFRISDWMDRVVRMMRAEECRMGWCWRPCAICSCPSRNRCSHMATRLRHPVEESYPRVQSPDGMFWGVETCVCVHRLLRLIEPAASPFLERMQETAGRIKAHKAYQMLDENGNYTWSTRWMILRSILVSTPGFILSSVLRFARLFALKEPAPANGSVPSPAGLPGENMFRPENSSIQRGRGVNTAVGLVPPFSV